MVGQTKGQVMDVTIRRVGVEQAREVLRIMQLAFEEYRGRLVPPSGALTETIDDVRHAINGGGAFLAFAVDTAVGSARYRLFPDHAYAERIAVLPEHRGRGVAVALMAAFEEAVRALRVPEARVGVRASLPSNLRFYETLGYRALASRPYPTGTDFEITLSKRVEAWPRWNVGGSAAQPRHAADAVTRAADAGAVRRQVSFPSQGIGIHLR
jgi:ribosomal protein S18 acetylase RimI-like enzyme